MCDGSQIRFFYLGPPYIFDKGCTKYEPLSKRGAQNNNKPIIQSLLSKDVYFES